MQIEMGDCDACLFACLIYEQYCTYVVGYQKEIPIVTKKAWCDGCETVGLAEYFPTRDQIQISIDSMRRVRLSEDLEKWIHFEETRKSLFDGIERDPKCLKCGSTRIQYCRFVKGVEGVEHRDCDGFIRFTGSGCAIVSTVQRDVYDLGGNILALGLEPTERFRPDKQGYVAAFEQTHRWNLDEEAMKRKQAERNPPSGVLVRDDGWCQCPNCDKNFPIYGPTLSSDLVHSCGQQLEIDGKEVAKWIAPKKK